MMDNNSFEQLRGCTVHGDTGLITKPNGDVIGIVEIPENCIKEKKNDTRNNIKTLWDSCIHNEETKEAYKVLKERPQGEWITDSIDNITCSNCGLILGSKVVKLLYPFDFPYCPDCGAKMKGGEEE